MVFNVTFNNISVISWRSLLLVKEIGVPGENHLPVASHWQFLSHNVLSSLLYHYMYMCLTYYLRESFKHPELYLMVSILCTCGQHFHYIIISPRREVYVHKTSSTPPFLFTEEALPSHKSESHVYVCKRVYMLPLFIRFSDLVTSFFGVVLLLFFSFYLWHNNCSFYASGFGMNLFQFNIFVEIVYK